MPSNDSSSSRCTLDAVVDERRVRRLPDAEVLELERAVETVEQALAAPEDDRRDDDRQLVDEFRLERLPDDVCAAHHVDVLVAGCRGGLLDRLPDSRHEREATAFGLVLGTVRDDEERQAPRVLAAPAPRGLARPAAADDGTYARHRLFEPHGALARPLSTRSALVCPRPAEHPVVQPLAALAEALAGAVVRPGDVPVDRRRDACQNLRHRKSPLTFAVENYDRSSGRESSSTSDAFRGDRAEKPERGEDGTDRQRQSRCDDGGDIADQEHEARRPP